MRQLDRVLQLPAAWRLLCLRNGLSQRRLVTGHTAEDHRSTAGCNHGSFVVI
ncbi:MAG UNVERIFIED_CONTAM: hypothetical protein LVR18_12105 [Planctomycetaceae bacterium]